MKKIALSGKHGTGKFTIVDDEDFEMLIQYTWIVLKEKRKKTGYCVARINKNTVPIHRFILSTSDPKIVVDHRNGDGLDNRKENLRECTNQQNLMNRGSQKNNRSGYKGVYMHKRSKLWTASISVNRKRIGLGCYNNKEDAAKAYNAGALKYHGEFARLNQI